MSGIVGVVTEKDCFSDLLKITTYHSHLGTEYGGIATSRRIVKPIVQKLEDQGEFWTKFKQYKSQLSGECGIGVISDRDEQPFPLTNKIGQFALATSGKISNLEEIAQEMIAEGASFSSSCISNPNTKDEKFSRNATEVIAHMLAKKGNLSEGIEYIFSKIKGSLSMILVGQNKLGEKGVYGFRDMHGITPLFLGRRGRDLAIANEDFALRSVGFDVEKMLAPGEFIKISRSGIKQKLKGDESKLKFCGFFPIYTGFPGSEYYNKRSVELIRLENGKLLAKDEKNDFDKVFGVPDSGKHHGMGFAHGLNKPYQECLLKYIYAFGGRSFTPQTQEERDSYGNLKQVSVPSLIEGQRIAVVDDSLVRGTQLAQTAQTKLWFYNPKEIHVRLSCPPLMFGCPFLNSTRTGELAARKAIRAIEGKDMEDISAYLNSSSPKYNEMIEIIRKGQGFTTLRYNTMENIINAMGMSKENLCTYCWDGCSCTKCSKQCAASMPL